MSTSTMDQLLASATRQEVLLAEIARTLQALLATAVRRDARDVTVRVAGALVVCIKPVEVAEIWADAAVWVRPLPSSYRRALWRKAVARVEALGQSEAWLKAEVQALQTTPLERLQTEIAASGTPDTCVAVWRANRTIVAALTKEERETTWKALVARVETTGKMKNADAWVRKELERLDAQAAREKGATP